MIPLPSAPKQHDQRNQNETRRSIEILMVEVQARLAAIETALSG